MSMARLRRSLLVLTALTCSVWASAQQPAPASCPPALTLPAGAALATARAAAPDRGLLWRVRKDGHDSYLYGTLHVGQPDWALPGPALRQAALATDTLAVELDITNPAILRDLGSALAGLPAPPLDDTLAKRLAQQVAAACLPQDAMRGLHPLMQGVTLTILAARWDAMDPAFGQEQALMFSARAEGKPVVSLESAQAQIQALIPANLPLALAALDDTLAQLESDRVRPMLRRMASAWNSGDLAALQSYEAWCDCVKTEDDRMALRRLNDDRNPAMAERIDAMHQQGQRVLVAVGALHMTGPQALPLLLATRGYEVVALIPKQP